MNLALGFSTSQLTFLSPASVPLENRQGSLTVNLTPNGIGAAWRLQGEKQWRASGTAVSGLAFGERQIEYRPVSGYAAPASEPANTMGANIPIVIARQYIKANESASAGGLNIVLEPALLSLPALPVAQRAQWRLLGEDELQWRDSGAVKNSLPAGNYLVEIKPLLGWSTPTPIKVTVIENELAIGVAAYHPAEPISGTPPVVLPFNTASVNPPYQYVGQLRSDVSSGSGFAVFGSNLPFNNAVVATAAHLVFNEGTLSVNTGLQWLFQRDSAAYEPAPLAPRGALMLTSYAAQRASENSPGASLPNSQNLDVAVLYFFGKPGRGGFSGYLASDLMPNEWLTSSSLKTLAGYPVAGIQAANQGRMHATPPANIKFIHSYGYLYSTSDIRSNGGNDGGPLCVQHQNGNYYPAGIFLGETGQTTVRSIDGEVLNLIDKAYIIANNLGGGDAGISQANTPLSGGITNPSLKVILAPSQAGSSGRWIFLGTAYQSGVQRDNVVVNPAKISFTNVHGYLTPEFGDVASIPLQNGNLTTVTARYKGITAHPQDSVVTAFKRATFSVAVFGVPSEARQVVTFQWRRNGVNIPGATSSSYALPFASSAMAGSYTALVTFGAEGTVISDPAQLTVLKASQAITFGQLPDRSLIDGPFTVDGSASSGLAVHYQSLSGPATMVGNGITPIGFGRVTIRATQGGTADWAAAAPVDRSFQIVGDTLDTWRSRYFSAAELANPDISGPLADPGRDNVNVLLAFALNLNPKTNDAAAMKPGIGMRGLPVATLAEVDGQLRLTMEYVRRRAAGTPGITYHSEFTSTLKASTSWTGGGLETAVPIDAIWERVKVSDSQPVGSSRVGRLRVTQP